MKNCVQAFLDCVRENNIKFLHSEGKIYSRKHNYAGTFDAIASVNDEKIIELCRSKGVNLIMLPDSEARGFYQH